MAGWDDDDDLLDAMLDDNGEDADNVSIVATSATTTTTVGAGNDDDGIGDGDDDNDAFLGGNEDDAGGGWGEDDDLDLDDLSSADENDDERGDDAGGVEDGGVVIQPLAPPSPLQRQEENVEASIPPTACNASSEAAATASTADPIKVEESTDSAMESMFAMLKEHEAMMEREIETIRDESFAQVDEQPKDVAMTIGSQEHDVNVSVEEEEEEKEEEWDFDEDDDIFNEDNDALDVGQTIDHDNHVMVEDHPTVMLNQVRKPSSPRLLSISPSPPPLASSPVPAVRNDSKQLSENPFLTREDEEEKDGNIEPMVIPTAEPKTDASDADDGWSDEDFFEEDDNDILPSSIAKPLSQTPPPPETPLQPLQQGIAPSVSPIPFANPTTTPVVRSLSPIPLNPTQTKIHQMLCNYLSTIHDPNFLSRLHQKLHQYQPPNAASDLKTYYATRPGLRKYTLGVELDRMDYNLILGNGKSTMDKDVIRSYFGVGQDGEKILQEGGAGGADGVGQEGETITEEELLIRSANQSLLADMLVALTGSEEDVDPNSNGVSEDDFFDQDPKVYGETQHAGLILSGPTLCMTSIAESCHFKVDLQCGKVEAACLLAISVPFHPNVNDHGASAEWRETQDVVVDEENGRLILARAKVSVRFRPGEQSGSHNDEPTVQTAVQYVTPLHTPENSKLIRQAAVSLARDVDHQDPFFQQQNDSVDESNPYHHHEEDARDRFLLTHHLLSSADSAALLAVSKDHINKLKGAAEKSSTGLRSALRQLDGVTNVSGKLGGLGERLSNLALPSAEEIEAAEREAAISHHGRFPPPPPSNDNFRFPRPPPERPNEGDPLLGHVRMGAHSCPQPPPQPPPPPPGVQIPPQAKADPSFSRPRPLIGGLFMSGLSRLAAAATQPDDQMEQSRWGGGGTGLTPPNSPPPPPPNGIPGNETAALHRREKNDPRGYTGLTPLVAKQVTSQHEFTPPAVSSPPPSSPPYTEASRKINEGIVDQDDPIGDDQDAGWSDDELDFDDDGKMTGMEKTQSTTNSLIGENPLPPPHALNAEFTLDPARYPSPIPTETATTHQQSLKDIHRETKAVLPPPPPQPLADSGNSDEAPPPPHHQQTQQVSFDEEFVIVLKEKIEAECREMEETGRMKRWTPLSEQPMLRSRLMEVMVSQIES